LTAGFRGRSEVRAGYFVLGAAIAIAMVSARNYAGSWNDGSRLATIESLVDYRTLAIDHSIFVQVPSGGDPSVPGPYPRDDPGLFPHGTGDKLFIKRAEFQFDRAKAIARLRDLEAVSELTGIPTMVGMVAPKGYEEMRVYTEFFLENSHLPFAVDTWTEKARLETARFIADHGLQDRFLYNSITAWDKDIPGQVQRLKDYGIRHVVVQAFDLQGDKRPSGRVKALDALLPIVEQGQFESILIDTSVMNLPTIGFTLVANRLVKEKFGWPSGCAPANGSYMWLAFKSM